MRAVPILLLVALTVAGCSESAEPSAAADAPSPSAATETAASTSAATTGTGGPDPLASGNESSAGPILRLTGCRNFGGVFPLPMESARAALPAGFEPVQTPSDPAGGATLYVLGLRCAGSSVDGADAGPATLAYAELAVVPPESQRLPGITDATVPLIFAATPQAVGDAAAALRLGQAGFGDVGWAEHTGEGDVVVAATLGEATFSLRGAYAPGAGGALGSGEFALYGVQDGVLVSRVLGSAAGGAAVDAAATLDTAGVGILAEARPVARGFSVSGFELSLQPAPA